MKAYEVTLNDEDKPQFAGTMADAKAIIKDADQSYYYGDLRVVEVEVQSDKEGVIWALNGVAKMTHGRTWRGTPRGGLKEELPEDRGEAAVS